MSKFSKIAIPIFLIFAVYIFIVLKPSNEIGSLETMRYSGEINQSMLLTVNKAKGFDRDATGNLIGFYVKDKNGSEAKIQPNKDLPSGILEAQVVEVLGHMHGETIVAAQISIVDIH